MLAQAAKIMSFLLLPLSRSLFKSLWSGISCLALRRRKSGLLVILKGDGLIRDRWFRRLVHEFVLGGPYSVSKILLWSNQMLEKHDHRGTD